MAKLKITKGTWRVNGSAVKANWPSAPVTICEVNHINFVDGKKAQHEEQVGNLFLIAASKDLYEALDELCMYVEFDFIPLAVKNKVLGALNKARP